MVDDETRFTRLYQEHYDRVFAYVRARSDPDVARDIVSETFLVAWRRLDELPQPSLPWLLGVARHKCAHHWERQGRGDRLRTRLGEMAAGAGSGDPAEEIDARMAALRALSALSPADREVLMLRAWDGLSTREAAEVLCCATAALAIRLHRARRRLARAFELERPEAGPEPSPGAGHRRVELHTTVKES
jgi:RNA polymerase sigma factor (sigma-70 family)